MRPRRSPTSKAPTVARFTVEARAAQLLDAYLRGYLSRPDAEPMPLEDIADLAWVARQWAEREAREHAASAACRQS